MKNPCDFERPVAVGHCVVFVVGECKDANNNRDIPMGVTHINTSNPTNLNSSFLILRSEQKV